MGRPIEATITHSLIKVVGGFPNPPPFTHWPALPVYFDQTTYKRNGGCLTASTLTGHKRVKQHGTYLNWTKIPMGDEEIQLLGLYIEPGDTKVTRGRVDKAVAIIQDMIRQDRYAHIVVGGDLNL